MIVDLIRISSNGFGLLKDYLNQNGQSPETAKLLVAIVEKNRKALENRVREFQERNRIVETDPGKRQELMQILKIAHNVRSENDEIILSAA